MSYKNSARMTEYIRQWRTAKSGKVYVHPSVNRKPFNHVIPPKLTGSSSLSNFGILYRRDKGNFTFEYLAGDRVRSLRPLKTRISELIPELCGIRTLRDGKLTMGSKDV